jgi:hypothetical protein
MAENKILETFVLELDERLGRNPEIISGLAAIQIAANGVLSGHARAKRVIKQGDSANIKIDGKWKKNNKTFETVVQVRLVAGQKVKRGDLVQALNSGLKRLGMSVRLTP